MSRRADAPPPALPSKPKYKGISSLPLPQEYEHARKAPLPHANEAVEKAAEAQIKHETGAPSESVAGTPAPTEPHPTPTEAPKLGGWPPLPENKRITAEESKEALRLYHQNPGFCPYCKIPITRGVTGHLAKCLRIQKSKTGSTTTT